MNQKPKILLTGSYKYDDIQIQRIQSLDYDVVYVQNELEKINIDVSDIEYVVCNGLFLHNDIHDFKNLKCVQATSAGLDRLPLEYMNKHNIKCFNAKGVFSIPISEWVVMFILNMYKSFKQFSLQQIEGEWIKNRDLMELTGKIVTIIGYGDIGKEIAKRLISFGVIIQVVDIIKIEDSIIHESYLLDDLNIALKNSDINILSIALSNRTFKLFDDNVFNHIKENSLLINVARGQLIDEKSLITHLDKFMGIGLDVFEKEPLPSDSPLWHSDNVLITPHNSYVSEKSRNRLFEVILNNLKSWRC